ncbi:hypothetical protein IMG5_068410, partial [Ichthyophthirius multifiliis]
MILQIQQDHIIKGFSVEKNFRIVFTENTQLLQNAIGEERIKVIVKFNNYEFYTESMANGEARGFVHKYEKNTQKENVLIISKIKYGFTQQQLSSIQLQFNENLQWINFSGKSIEDFYLQSDQIQNFCDLYTSFDINQRSFGYMIQAMPDCKKYYLEEIHKQILQNNQYICVKYNGLNYSNIHDLLYNQLNIKDIQYLRYPVQFYCRCSKSNIMSLILQLGKQTLKDMQNK